MNQYAPLSGSVLIHARMYRYTIECMYHGSHRFHHYSSWKHVLASVTILAIPIGILFVVGYFTNAPWATVFSSLGLSLSRLLIGYLLSLIVGAGLALAVGASRLGEKFLPVFDVLQNIPSFALIPLFIAAFGYSSVMIILFSATSIVWPIMFYSASAILGAKQELSDAAHVFGAKGWKKIPYYLIPLSFPALVTGSIVGISIGWEAVIGAEIIGNTTGIGSFLNSASRGGEERLFTIGIIALLVAVFIVNRIIWTPLLQAARKYNA